jgi:hypothetical protein
MIAMSRPAWPKLVVAFAFVAAAVAFVVSGGWRLLDLEAVKAHAEALRSFTETDCFQALAWLFWSI